MNFLFFTIRYPLNAIFVERIIMRKNGRLADELRKVVIQREYVKYAQGSALISLGNTKVICAAMVEERIPPFKKTLCIYSAVVHSFVIAGIILKKCCWQKL